MRKIKKVRELPSKIKEIKKDESLEEEIQESETKQFRRFIEQDAQTETISPTLANAQEAPQRLETQARQSQTEARETPQTFSYSREETSPRSTYRTLDQDNLGQSQQAPQDPLSPRQNAPILGQRNPLTRQRFDDFNDLDDRNTISQAQQQDKYQAQDTTIKQQKRRRDMI